MGKVQNASYLDLSSQNLTEIPEFVYSYRNLRSLNLSNNKITTVPNGITNLRNLRVLDLSKNRITQLQTSVFKLPKLQTLNLNRNAIKALPKQIGQLALLKKLFVNHNLLTTLPAEVASLQQLTHLAITGNKFSVFPKQLLELHTLTHLWLAKNPLMDFDPSDLTIRLPQLKAVYSFDPELTQTGMAPIIYQTRGNSLSEIKLISADRTNPLAKTTKRQHRSIFISYSHKDLPFKEEIETTLQAIQNVFPGLQVTYWADNQIVTGRPWEAQIETALEEAGIAILLTSMNFLASRFIMKKEVPVFLERAKANGVLMLVVVVGESLLNHTPLQKFQFVNSPDKPLKSLPDYQKDAVYTKLANEVINYFSVVS